jgi:hypothetical protein
MRLLTAACVVVVLPGGLWAQSSEGRDVLRVACDQARRTLRSPGRIEEVWHAIVEIQVCPEFAASSLAEMWDHPPTDSTGLRLLGDISGIVADRVLLDKVSAVAVDTARGSERRLAAIRALAAYAVPGASLQYLNLDRPGMPGSAYVMVGLASDRGVYAGPSPLQPADRSRAMQTLEGIGRADGDAVVRAIAEYLPRVLALYGRKRTEGT